MKKLFKEFRDKYRVKESAKKIEDNKQAEEKEASTLALKLNAVFIIMPVLKPYGKDLNKVKLSQDSIDTILEIVNTSNQIILQNQFYNEVKEILQKILEQNENGILINSELSRQSRIIKKFSNSLQGKEYWEEKSF